MSSPAVTSQNSTSQNSKFGLYLSLGVGVAAIGCSVLTIPFLTPALRKHALPYVPATPKQIKNVFKAIRSYSSANQLPLEPNGKNLIKLIDLGSGDGRIVFEAAKRGYHSTGVEINSVLVFYSRLKALTSWSKIKNESAGLVDPSVPLYSPKFKCANFWNLKMNEYDLIVVFGVQEMMKDLASKLKTEMKPNTLIVSCRNPIKCYQDVYNLDDDIDSVWIYDKNSLFTKIQPKETNKNDKKKVDDDDDDD